MVLFCLSSATKVHVKKPVAKGHKKREAGPVVYP